MLDVDLVDGFESGGVGRPEVDAVEERVWWGALRWGGFG